MEEKASSRIFRKEENPIYKDMVLIEIGPCAAETIRLNGMAEKYINKNMI